MNNGTLYEYFVSKVNKGM